MELRTVKDKRNLYDKHRVAVGGANPAESEGSSGPLVQLGVDVLVYTD